MPNRILEIPLSFLLLLATLLAACDIPRDPEETSQRVRNGVMRVGIVHNPPWTVVTEDQVSGVEVTLVEALADEMGAEMIWVAGTESELLAALKEFELELVIGGLVGDSPSLAAVAVTQPYFTSHLSVGVSSADSVVTEIAGREIAVPFGSEAAALLQKEEAVPLRVLELSSSDAPLVAPDWLIALWRLENTGIRLTEYHHVMAAPPGENGWLAEVEGFLVRHREDVRRALQEVEP